jgi:predicted alpha/beta superfamily hydrolase
MSEALRASFRRVMRLENRRTAIRPGRLERIRFESEILGNERDITVYLPAGYDEKSDRRYPVLYMQDGQNLFDAERAYIPGQHWQLKEAADAAIGERAAAPMIIVGVDHAGIGRADEYTPTRSEKHKSGGKAGEYVRMLVEELKPLIDERFRTLPDAANTGIGGSSLGGLVSLHAALTRPDVFGRIAAMSPSVWWGDRHILKTVDAYDGPPLRMWADIGGREGMEALHDVRSLRDRIDAKGWRDRFRYYEDRRADHSERAWQRRVKIVLEFLFPLVN